jgi:hypothetical protein
MFYILGPLDAEVLKKTEPVSNPDGQAVSAADIQHTASALSHVELSPEQFALLQIENETVHYGKVEADCIALSKLH